MPIMTDRGLMSGRQYLIEEAKAAGLEVELTSPGDSNTHYIFKLDGQELMDAKGLNTASIWLDGYRTARIKAAPVKRTKKSKRDE